MNPHISSLVNPSMSLQGSLRFLIKFTFAIGRINDGKSSASSLTVSTSSSFCVIRILEIRVDVFGPPLLEAIGKTGRSWLVTCLAIKD